MKRSVKITQDA